MEDRAGMAEITQTFNEMKDNHIPRSERLKRRINNLYSKLGGMWVPYGRPNPYHYCRYCGKSQPSCSYEGHGRGCLGVGIKNEIKYYESIR
jgi:hypothetical protein